MNETGETIGRLDRLRSPGHAADWFDDGYAYDQAAKAALRVLCQSRPAGNRRPHGPLALVKDSHVALDAATPGRDSDPSSD